MLRKVDEILDDPLRSRMRSFWIGHSVCADVLHFGDHALVSGVIESFGDKCFNVTPCTFHPWKGFVVEEDISSLVTIEVIGMNERLPRLREDDAITIYGTARWVDDHFVFEKDAIIAVKPELAPALPFHALHLFSGGFMGWSKAFEQMKATSLSIGAANQIFVDHDKKVMDCWAKTYGLTVHYGPSSPRTSLGFQSHVGLCTTVADKTICHQCQFHENLILTMSPPCVSWSRGGRALGLNCSAGFAFQEAIEIVEIVQPLAFFGECADLTPSHPHFHLLEASIKVLGYKRVWQQIVHMHTLSNNMRSRWLFAWVRADVPAELMDLDFDLRAPPLTPWHSPLNQLWIPESVACQLTLSPDLLAFYSAVDLLPPAKRTRLSSAQSFDVLRSRVACESAPLPTLCSSYAMQHSLSSSHVAEKGIFAFLVETDDTFRFINPMCFVPMFGVTSRCLVPKCVPDAFLFLGNAITVPHALLCLCVGIASILDLPLHISQEIRRCWRARLCTSQSVVVEDGDYLVVWPWSDFCNQLVCRDFGATTGLHVSVDPAHAAPVHMWVPSVFTVADFVSRAFGLPAHLLRDVSACVVHEQPVPKATTIRQMRFSCDTWQIFFRNTLIATIVIDLPSFEHPCDIAPTLPYACEDVGGQVFAIRSGDWLDSPAASDVLAVTEFCNELEFQHADISPFQLVWEEPPMSYVCDGAHDIDLFVANIFQRSRFQSRIVQHKVKLSLVFLALLPSWYS